MVFKASKVSKARKASKAKMAATVETGKTERRFVKKNNKNEIRKDERERKSEPLVWVRV